MSTSPYVTTTGGYGYACPCGGWVYPGLGHRHWPEANALPQTPVPEGWRLALSAEDVDRIARRVVELWEADSDAVASLPRPGGSVK